MKLNGYEQLKPQEGIFGISHHSKYLITMAVFYLGVGVVTIAFPRSLQTFPDEFWISLVSVNFISCFIGAVWGKFRKYAYAVLATMPLSLAASFAAGYVVNGGDLLLSLCMTVAYVSLFFNHYFVARRPDFNIFISNVLRKSGDNRIPEEVKAKLREMM